MADTGTSKERINFVKCCLLITKTCRGVMFEIVERSIEPSFQELTLDELKKIYETEDKKFPESLSDLFKTLNGMIPVETDFDISSLFFLINFFCKFDPPTNGWGETVRTQERLSVGDAVEKILSIRDDILKKYGPRAEIPDGEFNDIKGDIESMIKLLESQYGGRKFQDSIGRINADEKANAEETTPKTTSLCKIKPNEEDKNARKESKMILKEFLKCCETAVDLDDKRITRKDIENAEEFLKAAGADPKETLRQQEIALRELKELVEQLKGHIKRANNKIESLEKENKKLKEENEKLRKDRTST